MSEASSPTRRPGGRSARVHEAVSEAALAQLLEVGYPRLTIRGVAQAAGVAETTVYRRWPTVEHLVAAAVLRLADQDNPIPDTGTLEGDLRTLLTQIVALLDRPDVLRVVRSAAALDDDESVLAARNAFFGSRFRQASSIVTRAIDRGELSADADPHLIIETLVAPAYVRAVLASTPLDDELVDHSVRIALAAAT